jgi:predicted TIM-barrel fold metal-dependent hydrolase
MSTNGFISADSHVNEPEAAYARIPKKLREKGPHFIQDPPGKKGLYVGFDGYKPDPVGTTFLAGTNREPAIVKDIVENFTWERWPGPWDPKARLGDMDKDNVQIEVLYPSMARNFYTLKAGDTPLQLAGLQSYNDWMVDYCNAAPKRLYGLGLLSVLDVDWSVKEMERSAKLGLLGVMLPANLPPDMSYADPKFEPIWAAAEGLGFPVHFHINVKQSAERDAYERGETTMLQVGRRMVRRQIDEPVRLFTDLLFGLVLENHPRLKVVLAEYELVWILPFIGKMDGNARRFGQQNPKAPHMTLSPGETIRRQVYITFQNDPGGVAAMEALGLIDNCMWASDYPHGGSTWPESRQAVASQVRGLSAEKTRKLTWDNAAKMYGIG